MPRNSGRVMGWLPGAVGVSLLLAPAALRGQASATMTVQATVVSAEAQRSWQAVAARLHQSGGPATGATPARPTLATIVERTEQSAQGVRRVVHVDYLRN